MVIEGEAEELAVVTDKQATVGKGREGPSEAANLGLAQFDVAERIGFQESEHAVIGENEQPIIQGDRGTVVSAAGAEQVGLGPGYGALLDVDADEVFIRA